MTDFDSISRCPSCGAPYEKRRGDAEPTHGGRCSGCINPDGTPKGFDEIVTRLASYLVRSLDLHPDAAAEIAHDRISSQLAWRQMNQRVQD